MFDLEVKHKRRPQDYKIVNIGNDIINIRTNELDEYETFSLDFSQLLFPTPNNVAFSKKAPYKHKRFRCRQRS